MGGIAFRCSVDSCEAVKASVRAKKRAVLRREIFRSKIIVE